MNIENKLRIGPLTIEKEIKFGGAFLHVSIEDFIKAGFNFGDTVNLIFSNGVVLNDVPFYSGYYVDFDELLIVGYQGYPWINITYNFGGDFLGRAKVTEDCTVIIEMNEKAKHLDIQELFQQNHSNDRNDYESDESFCNFRAVADNVPNTIKIYRSASPCDNDYNRPHYVSELCKKYDIKYVLDLADKQDNLDSYYNQKDVDNEYWKYLYEQKRVIPMRLEVNYHSKECANTLVELLRFMLNNEGPFLMHCSEGKDRTGFAGIVIGALANQSIEEIEKGYTKTYEEYYHITKQSVPDSYKAIKNLYFDRMINYICKDSSQENIKECCEKYLLDNGMSIEEIKEFESRNH